MPQCQIQSAAAYAFARGSTPVEDRRMTLEMNCREPAVSSAQLLGAAGGRARKGASARGFTLCENHSELVAQIDRELVEDGWSTAFAEKPRFLS